MLRTRVLGLRPYAETEAAMRQFTLERTRDAGDELWLVEHPPVFTLGVAGREMHVHAAGAIPVVRTERGGQVTYHGPGQVVAYPLIDLRRARLYVRDYVFRLEEALIDTLWAFGVVGHRVRGAPGVYVRPADPAGHAVLRLESADPFRGLAKIAAIGVKVTQQCTWHGVALNVAMDLEPFGRIDPCGYAGLATTDLASLGVQVGWNEAAGALARSLGQRLGTC